MRPVANPLVHGNNETDAIYVKTMLRITW